MPAGFSVRQRTVFREMLTGDALRDTHNEHRRPVSGLTRGMKIPRISAFPCLGHSGIVLYVCLAYRCGGSAGIA